MGFFLNLPTLVSNSFSQRCLCLTIKKDNLCSKHSNITDVMWHIFFSMNWIKNSKHTCLTIFATLPINRTYLPFVKVISPTQQVNVICECFLIQTHKSSSKPQKNSHNLNLRSKTYYLLPFECKTKFNILFIFCWIFAQILYMM